MVKRTYSSTTLMLVALAAFISAAHAQAPAEPIGQFTIGDLRLQSISTDRIQLAGRALVKSTQKAEIQRVTFTGVTLSGTPVFLAPIEQKLELLPGQLTALPGEVQVMIYFRDVDPAGVERVLSANQVQMDGNVTLQVELSFLQSIAMMKKSVTSRLHFNGTMPLEFPGGNLSREAALTAVRLAKPIWGPVKNMTAGAERTLGLSWTEEMLAQYRGSLAYVLSRYQMRDKKGKVYPFTYSCVAFRVSPSEFIVPKEAIRPWEFDQRAILLVKNSKGKVIGDGTDVLLFPAGMAIQGPADNPSNGLRLSLRQLRLVKEGAEDMEPTILLNQGKRQRASIHRRVSMKNFAVLQVTDSSVSGAVPQPAMDPDASKPYWEKAAAFRSAISSSGEIKFEAIALRARREGNKVVLEDPVDRTVIGSPVVIGPGILAIVQDERGGVMIRETFTANNYHVATSFARPAGAEPMMAARTR